MTYTSEQKHKMHSCFSKPLILPLPHLWFIDDWSSPLSSPSLLATKTRPSLFLTFSLSHELNPAPPPSLSSQLSPLPPRSSPLSLSWSLSLSLFVTELHDFFCFFPLSPSKSQFSALYSYPHLKPYRLFILWYSHPSTEIMWHTKWHSQTASFQYIAKTWYWLTCIISQATCVNWLTIV